MMHTFLAYVFCNNKISSWLMRQVCQFYEPDCAHAILAVFLQLIGKKKKKTLGDC